MSIAGLWDALVDAICRPPRDTYSISELPGGKRGRFKLKDEVVERKDITLINKAGQRLECSHFRPESTNKLDSLPIVIYCHCNSGSRRDAEEALFQLLPNGITVFSLDFAGSGNSQGDWVTLGAHEVEDLEVVVAHLRQAHPSATIGLWGRSMGAVTALLYSARDPSIAGVVIDSAFARLTELMVELVEEQKLPIPKPFMRIALGMMRRSVRKRAKFNIDSVAPLDVVPNCHIPVLFGHANEDTFVKKSHSERLYAAYGGADKQLETFSGDHNSIRTRKFYTSVLIFFHRALLCDALGDIPLPDRRRTKEEDEKAECEGDTSGSPSSSDRSSQAEEGASSQHQIAPPWDKKKARSFTEKQLQAIRDDYNADLALREKAKGIPKEDPKHPLLANPCLKSNSDSINRLAMSHPATSGDLDSMNRLAMSHLATSSHRGEGWSESESCKPASGDPWEMAQLAGGPPPPNNIFERQANAPAAASARAKDNAARVPSFKPLIGDPMVAKRQEESNQSQELPDDLALQEEEENLRRALALSLQETRPRGNQSLPWEADPRRSQSLRSHIPEQWQSHDLEDAEEYMLAEALRQSLLEAESQGLVDRTSKSSPTSQSTPENSRRRRSGLFWKSKSDISSKTPTKDDNGS